MLWGFSGFWVVRNWVLFQINWGSVGSVFWGASGVPKGVEGLANQNAGFGLESVTDF